MNLFLAINEMMTAIMNNLNVYYYGIFGGAVTTATAAVLIYIFAKSIKQFKKKNGKKIRNGFKKFKRAIWF